METQESKATAGNDTSTGQKIIEAYREYVLLNGEEPPSIFAFCKVLGISEAEFYERFNDFEQVADAFWTSVLTKVLDETQQEGEYDTYNTREKVLTFYYNFFEELKKHRSYALLSFRDSMAALKKERNLSQMKREYKYWIKDLIYRAQSDNEIASRSRLSETYDTLFWYQFLFLLNFWRKDRSIGFEKTDAAIEKAVNLSFDLIEKNAIDSAFDFGKFMFQNR